MEDRIISYGGQAVIEGVMMRGRAAMALAMRAPNGQIVLHTEKLGSLYRSRVSRIPFVRGVVLLWDALGLGMRALTIAANTQTGEDEKLEGPALYLTLGIALLLGLSLFFLVPAGVGAAAEHWLHVNAWWSNLLEGAVRLVLLVGYIWGIGFMPDIKRVFAYHGAEHKTINAYEAGADLTPDVVAGYSLEHPRCGTAFLLDPCAILDPAFQRAGPASFDVAARQPRRVDSRPGRRFTRVHPLDCRALGEPAGPVADQAKSRPPVTHDASTGRFNAGGCHRGVQHNAQGGTGVCRLKSPAMQSIGPSAHSGSL